ncbi:hypothetical protein LTR70_006553 [Exophiala xenobiotica]|uniref:Histone deacetylase domain-containing protein n=1 Tax=Lithohypha guttulata TaxID=1690604 RepID=A0ABR0K8T5_9EURO|nr:hypothetical protein LTR24_006004 [Lithohypha guttulata]KAK5315911.1 hypothetical protein LTR70_006553 [Exophiala xenobiotica]
MIILHDEDTLLHETVELLGSKLIPAFESPSRIKAIVQSINHSGKHDLRTITASAADQTSAVELAKATHSTGYLSHIQHVFKQWLDEGLVEEHGSVLPECFRLHNTANSKLKPPKDTFARPGYYAFDMSSGISQHSWRAIIASANLAVQAAHLLLPTSPTSASATNGDETEAKSVLALCRPPGHHCSGQQAGGYCYINNIALAITTFRHFSPPAQKTRRTSNPHFSSTSRLKFAILDLDFHHGNGTQELFYGDPNVLYVSIHGEDEFPYYTGAASETGPPAPDPAHGTNLNLPLATGSSFDEYLRKLHVALQAVRDFKADYLLVSLGFDTFHLDPLGKFDIRTENYKVMGWQVRSALRDIPGVIALEGGYVVDRLGENLLNFLEGWEIAEKRLDCVGLSDGQATSTA